MLFSGITIYFCVPEELEIRRCFLPRQKKGIHIILNGPRGVTSGITSDASSAAGLIKLFSFFLVIKTIFKSSGIAIKTFIKIGSKV